jgi:hypothetical protein
MSAQLAHPNSRRVLQSGLAWMLCYLGALYVLKTGAIAAPWGVVIALLPAPAFAWFVWHVIAALRSADELERRVNLEGLAFAFPAAMLLVMTLGLFELVVDLPREDWSYRHIWAWFPPLYGLGVALAWSKYK